MIIAVIAVMMVQMGVVEIVGVVAMRDHWVVTVLGSLSPMGVTRVL
jgi:hypothetical protein